MSKFLLRSQFIIFLFAAAPALANSAYTVQVDRSMKQAHVRADVEAQRGMLSMSGIGADQLDRGWATFVRDLEAKDRDGHPLSLQKMKQGWLIDGSYRGEVHLTYDVDLSFAHQPWPAGNEQAGWATADSLFLVARPLFIFGEDEPATIDFVVPQGWSVVTPWSERAAARRQFTAEDQAHLTENTIVLGMPAVVRVAEGPFLLQLALLGKAAEAAPQLTRVLKGAVSDYVRLFPNGKPEKFLMTFFYADADDGEAYRNSAAFTGSDILDDSGKLIWANFIAHEAFHHWNGQMIRSADKPHMRWFSEGFTEYFANLALVRTKVITSGEWLRKAERHVGLYQLFRSSPIWSDVSLRAAGEKNSSNRPGVYDGGWTTALCLDAEIRKQTSGRRSLRDFMTTLYERFGVPGVPYKEDDLKRVASETAKADLRPFFSKYVDGTEALPVKECFATFGIKAASKPYAGEAYLALDSAADGKARSERASLFNLR